MLKLKGLREKYFVLVGGAPVTDAWVAEIGAEATGKDAHQAVEVLEARLSLKEEG
jgi:monomethylamine corrinoid protein